MVSEQVRSSVWIDLCFYINKKNQKKPKKKPFGKTSRKGARSVFVYGWICFLLVKTQNSKLTGEVSSSKEKDDELSGREGGILPTGLLVLKTELLASQKRPQDKRPRRGSMSWSLQSGKDAGAARRPKEERTFTTNNPNNNNNNNDNDNEEVNRNSYYSGEENYYNNQQQLDEAEFRSYPTTTTTNNNRDNGGVANYYLGSSFNSGPAFRNTFQPQGMSDTRHLEGGKYFYDVNSDKYSNKRRRRGIWETATMQNSSAEIGAAASTPITIDFEAAAAAPPNKPTVLFAQKPNYRPLSAHEISDGQVQFRKISATAGTSTSPPTNNADPPPPPSSGNHKFEEMAEIAEGEAAVIEKWPNWGFSKNSLFILQTSPQSLEISQIKPHPKTSSQIRGPRFVRPRGRSTRPNNPSPNICWPRRQRCPPEREGEKATAVQPAHRWCQERPVARQPGKEEKQSENFSARGREEVPA